MKKKIIGICISMLLIATAIPAIAAIQNSAITTTNPNTSQASTNRGWIEKQKLLPSDGAADDRFGVSVAVDDSDAIVGAYFDDVGTISDAGSAYVFTYTGGNWTQQAKLTAPDYASDDEFGTSVSLSGDYAIVGAPNDDDDGTSSGSAYIFKRSGTTWVQQGKITASDATASDKFGQSVDIDGDYAIIGAPGKNYNQGFAYIFVRSGTTWSQQAKVGAAVSTYSYLGYSVSISEDTVVMGAYGANGNTGTAYIYQHVGTSWYLKAKLTSSDGLAADYFGNSVSIDTDAVLVGAPGHDLSVGGEGAAYIFKKPSTGWTNMTETVELTASDAHSADHFGMQVSIAGNYTVIASPDDDVNGTDSGSAYIFTKKATSWSQQAKLKSSDGATYDYFGWSVSIHGISIQDIMVFVGAYADDNSNGNDAGSTYFYSYVNHPPSAPTISGPDVVHSGDPASYNFSSWDPEGDDVYYFIQWGDGTQTPGWLGPYPSGDTRTVSHSWHPYPLAFTIRAKAKDTHNAESDWSTLKIHVPCSNIISEHWFWETIFARFPHSFPLLRQLLGY